jgi:PadR family transcriptional regulator PadR
MAVFDSFRSAQTIPVVSNERYRVSSDLDKQQDSSPIANVVDSMYDWTGFQRDCLYIIAGLETPHGLAIKDKLDDYYEKEIQHGRLYPNLDTLVEKGLVEKGQYDRRTNTYTLTQRGQREIKARSEWETQYIEH